MLHDLYNMGHLYEAAVAYYQATGKRQLPSIRIAEDILCKAQDSEMEYLRVFRHW